MRRIFLCLAVLLSACRNHASNDPDISLKADSNPEPKSEVISQVDTSNFQEMGINAYKERVIIDTDFRRNDDFFYLYVENDFDTSKQLIIPKKYVEIYGMNSLKTFEKYTRIRFTKNREMLFDSILYKKDFIGEIDSSLVYFGTLMYPVVRYSEDFIEIGHSISIPMTDVGVGVSRRYLLPKN